MPYDLLGKGSLYSSLIIIIGFMVHWLVKSLGGIIDKVMEEGKSREEMLKKELSLQRKESRDERFQFIQTIDRYNDSLQELSNTIKVIQTDVLELKNNK